MWHSACGLFCGMIINLIAIWMLSMGAPKGDAQTSVVGLDSLQIGVLNYDELKPLLQYDNDTTYVVNFWATWCVPCVKELPHFLTLEKIYRDRPFRVLFVSLDFKKDYVRKLQPFVDEYKMNGRVVVLEDNRADY